MDKATGLATESHIVSGSVSFGSHAENTIRHTMEFAQWDRLQQIQVCVVISQTSEDELKCVALDISELRGRNQLKRQIAETVLEDIYPAGMMNMSSCVQFSA